MDENDAPARGDRASQEAQAEERHRTGRDPHHALNNPVRDPDPTEYPDPYEKRPDPRDPASVDTPADPADPDVAGDEPPRGPSTSDPPPPRNHDRLRRDGVDR
jgi:hypothetical protein